MSDVKECPLCGGQRSLDFYGFGAPNRIGVKNRICADCGLVFQSPRPNYEELTAYYERYSETTQPEIAEVPVWFEEHVTGIARLRLSYLQRFLRNGDRVLDIGSSFGALLNVLGTESGLDLKLMGVNPEASYARFGSERYGLDIRVGMFERLNFEPESFDVVLLDNVIEHFESPRGAVSEINRLLAPGGRFFVATNNLAEPHGLLWQNFFRDHTVTFSPRTLTALLESQGFSVLDLNTDGHTTYDGYRYPYIHCMAQKAPRPKQYDFRANGDDAAFMVAQARAYVKASYEKDGLAKRLYEVSVQPNPGPIQRLKAKMLRVRGGISGQKLTYVPAGHTLPPEEFFYRRVMVAFCTTPDDIALALELLRVANLNPLLFLYIKDRSSKWYSLASHPSGAETQALLRQLAKPNEFLQWALRTYPRIDEFIFLRLHLAEVEADHLGRTHREFRDSGASVEVFQVEQPPSERPFSGSGVANWLMARGKAIDELKGVAIDKEIDETIARRRNPKRRTRQKSIVVG